MNNRADLQTEQVIEKRVIRVALAGNPNTGKTTLFNALTGLNQKTGNYPGVTVERKTGYFDLSHSKIELVDLPGTYSMAARSPDEMVVTDILLEQQEGEAPIDSIVAIVDASNINRNFYLVSQLLELGKPVVIALNMIDQAEAKQIQIDAEGLSRKLGIPVVPTCANRRQGIDRLYEAIDESLANSRNVSHETSVFPEEFRLAVYRTKEWISDHKENLDRPISEIEIFRALTDHGGYAEKRLVETFGDSFKDHLNQSRQSVNESLPLAAIEVKTRYDWIASVLNPFITRPERPVQTRSDAIDRVITHKYFGFLIFVGLMGLVFQAIYSWAAPLMDFIDHTFALLGETVTAAMPAGALQSLIADGIIGGVGAVVIFLPQIAILFFLIAILEDCGYMPRAAFIMDRLLSHCGLSGKSFIPMLSSFACAVPGIMATRTIENRRDRIATICVAPLMSCSARLPVYLILIGAFIPNQPLLGTWFNLQGATLFLLYFIGIAVAIPVAWILKKLILKGETPPFVMELPSYQWPTPRTIIFYVYDRAKEFLIRAGTIIFFSTVVVWALAYFPHSDTIDKQYNRLRVQAESDYLSEALPLLASLNSETYSLGMNASGLEDAIQGDSRFNNDANAFDGIENQPFIARVLALRDHYLAQIDELDRQEAGDYLRGSYLAWMGRMIEPVVRPLGWDWQVGMAVIASFPAREVVVATLSIIFNMGGETGEETQDSHDAIRSAKLADGTPLFNIAAALSIMVFFALCCQCAATLATIRRETHSYRWPVAIFGYMTVLAYLGALFTYQIGCMIGLG